MRHANLKFSIISKNLTYLFLLFPDLPQ